MISHSPGRTLTQPGSILELPAPSSCVSSGACKNKRHPAYAVQEPERRPGLDKLVEHPALNSAFAIAVSAATSLSTFGKRVLGS